MIFFHDREIVPEQNFAFSILGENIDFKITFRFLKKFYEKIISTCKRLFTNYTAILSWFLSAFSLIYIIFLQKIWFSFENSKMGHP